MNNNFLVDENKITELKLTAKNMRLNMLDMMKNAGANGAHIGGAYSACEVLACLYKGLLNINPASPLDPNRDRFILSKGHVAIALYSALYEAGFITKEELFSFEENESHFGTHCSKYVEKGIELSSGSLGLGLSYGCGCAYMAKLNKQNYDTVVLVGDGECNEGSVWEAVQSCAKFKLDNLILVIDINKQCLDGFTENVMSIYDFDTIFKGFGWNVKSINGNNVKEVCEAFTTTPRNNKPTVLLSHTLKGFGLSLTENKTGWHHASLTQEQYDQAKAELEAK